MTAIFYFKEVKRPARVGVLRFSVLRGIVVLRGCLVTAKSSGVFSNVCSTCILCEHPGAVDTGFRLLRGLLCSARGAVRSSC